MFDFLDDVETYNYIDADLSNFDVIYIDSNIFMLESASYFFDKLTNKNKVIIPSVQYSEMYKIKSSSDKEKSYKARKAFKTIESLVDKNIAKIVHDDDPKNKETYADPVFIDCIIKDIRRNKKVVFVTDDIDLRIQLKSKLKNHIGYDNKNNIKVYSKEDILKKDGERKVETSALKKTGKIAGAAVALVAASAIAIRMNP